LDEFIFVEKALLSVARYKMGSIQGEDFAQKGGNFLTKTASHKKRFAGVVRETGRIFVLGSSETYAGSLTKRTRGNMPDGPHEGELPRQDGVAAKGGKGPGGITEGHRGWEK